MRLSVSCAVVCVCISALGLGVVSSASAQEVVEVRPREYQNVISANPFGLLLEFFNAEYERKVGQTTSAGIGGSFFSDSEDDDDFRYINGDVFFRYYPQGEVFNGWAFGAKVGLTSVRENLAWADSRDAGTFFGFGFDVNRSWLLGANDNFYVGLGLGLKRLFGTSGEAFDLQYVPTFRIVNVGFAF
jgi:hypothetical protein